MEPLPSMQTFKSRLHQWVVQITLNPTNLWNHFVNWKSESMEKQMLQLIIVSFIFNTKFCFSILIQKPPGGH
jgi:hypothetical protein